MGRDYTQKASNTKYNSKFLGVQSFSNTYLKDGNMERAALDRAAWRASKWVSGNMPDNIEFAKHVAKVER